MERSKMSNAKNSDQNIYETNFGRTKIASRTKKKNKTNFLNRTLCAASILKTSMQTDKMIHENETKNLHKILHKRKEQQNKTKLEKREKKTSTKITEKKSRWKEE